MAHISMVVAADIRNTPIPDNINPKSWNIVAAILSVRLGKIEANFTVPES